MKTYDEFGGNLRIEREKRGWDQLALAKALETTQQTVSRWEKGSSRPRMDVVQKAAELFEINKDEWLMQAGYQIAKPVRPLVPHLPLDKLSEETFEMFNRDFIQKLRPNAEVHRYGSRGHKQNGIDIFAKENGKKTDYQAKRHQQFGPADVDAAVKATTTIAEHHFILLSRPASTGARDAIDKYDDWSLWDVEDISVKVRLLSMQDKLDLVDTYFPGWRKHFLGIENPAPWLSPDKYFRPFNGRSRVFNHDWDFVGRAAELTKLADFARNSINQVTLLNGQGGIGKSRLLKALAENLKSDTQVIFMTQQSEPTPADIEQLPQNGLLIIEDAHEYSDLRALLSGIAVYRPNLKILFSTRPYGVALLEERLIQTGLGFDHDETVKLNKMKLADAEDLAREVIKENNGDEQYAHRIAEITLDCPLATVIGARLVAEGKIQPDILANSDTFRFHLLRSFRDIITGQIGGIKDASIVKDLLDLISVLQPIDVSDPAFEEAVKVVLELPLDKVMRDIRALEDAGVLLRRKNLLRIAPDLLSDFIRADASFDQNSGIPTGYVDRIFKAVKNDLATNLLVNLSQLDWRLSADGTQATLLDKIWEDLLKQFMAANINGRVTMLKALEKVAYYQPSQAIAFAKIAIDNPTDEFQKTEFDHLLGSRPNYGAVLTATTPILKYAAYTDKYMTEALDLLKGLAEQDGRPQAQHTDHPMRAIQEITAIVPRKPVGYIEHAINHVLGWLEDTPNENFSPFDILDGALITDGHESEFKGRQFILKPFNVNAKAVENIRNSVINAAISKIENGSLPQSVRAVQTIEHALHGPFGQDVTAESKTKWEPGQIALLQRLESIVANTALDPFIAVEVRKAVNWHASFSKSKTRPAANAVLKAIPTTIDHQLSRALADGWGWSFERSTTNFERDEATFVQWKKELALKIISDYAGRFGELVELLEKRTTDFKSTDMKGAHDSGRFLYELMQESEALAEVIGQYIIDYPKSSMADNASVAVSALSSMNHKKAVQLAKNILSTGDLMTQRRIAFALGWALNGTVLSEEELPIVKSLVSSKDVYVRKNIARVVRRFSEARRYEGLEILMSMDFSDSKDLASEVLGEFDKNNGHFKVEELTPNHLDHIHDQLLQVDTIDAYEIGEFAKEMSFLYPGRILKLLFERVDNKATKDSKRNYYPIPLAWENHNALRINETKDYKKSLESVRSWINEEQDSWERHHYGPEIFRAVSGGYDDITLSVVNEWAMSSDTKQVETAANLLSEFPASFLWDDYDMVVAILENANQLSKECYGHVSSSLHSASYRGGRSGTHGEPYAEDILQRDKTLEIIEKLPTNSPAYKFYKSLHEIALSGIKRSLEEGADLDDED
jgi:transcriptional regulator with XRE-family HTH domain